MVCAMLIHQVLSPLILWNAGKPELLRRLGRECTSLYHAPPATLPHIQGLRDLIKLRLDFGLSVVICRAGRSG
jgi:3-methyladenine DNA glycosylase AlkC